MSSPKIAFTDRLIPQKIDFEVCIPRHDRTGIAYVVVIKLDQMHDPVTGVDYLRGDALNKIDQVKGQHLGVLTPMD